MAVESTTSDKIIGYLPNEKPEFGKMILLGFQHVITMFPATVLAALLMGFPVNTVLAVTGFGTVVALTVSKLWLGFYIPLYYGSSFSYIAAVLAFTAGTFEFGGAAPPEVLSVVQVGFLATGLINIITGFLIRGVGGKQALDKVLPPVITGSVATTIGIGLGKAALDMSSGVCCGADGSGVWWTVAIITLTATILFSVYLQGKGFIGLLPILLGAIVGYIVAIPFGLVDFSVFGQTSLVTTPHLTFPTFNDQSLTIIFSVGIMAIATIPESTAHLYQISLYVDHLAVEQGKERYFLSRYVGANLVIDGLNDFINGLFGSTAGTNYGENNSLMVITRNYSGPVLMTAGVIAVLLGFIGPLKDAISSVPTAVSGGLAIYLFGVIGMQGIALMMSEKVNLFDPKQLAIGAIILIVGIGGNIGFPGGFLPIPLLQGVFPNGWPAIATAAVLGIVFNLIFRIFPAPERDHIDIGLDH